MMFARASGFDPLSLSPALWLSDTGSDPSVWNDLSGNGRHATQATAANQPAIVAGAQNGRQVRRFDGSNDFLKTGVLATSVIQPVNWFIACKANATNGRRIIEAETIGGVTGPRNTLRLNGSNSEIYAGSLLTGTFNSTSFVLHEILFNAGSSYWKANQSTITSGNAGTEGFSTLVIGAFRSLGSDFFDGDIAEILAFPTALSTADRQAVEAYLNAKWAIY